MTTTRAQLDSFAVRLSDSMGRKFYVEGSASGFNLYEELNPGAHDVLFGKTKSELWDLMHAFAEGVRYSEPIA